MQEFVSINVDLVLLTAAEAGLSPEQQRLRTILLKVQQYCDDYEAKIRSLGTYKSKIVGCLRVFFSILVTYNFMLSGALDSSDIL